jgi:hypothetical protein
MLCLPQINAKSFGVEKLNFNAPAYKNYMHHFAKYHALIYLTIIA